MAKYPEHDDDEDDRRYHRDDADYQAAMIRRNIAEAAYANNRDQRTNGLGWLFVIALGILAVSTVGSFFIVKSIETAHQIRGTVP